MVVLDTSFLIDLIKKDKRAMVKLLALEEDNEMICTTIVNVLELFKGAYRSSQTDKNKRLVEEIISSLILLQIEPGVLDTFGKLSSELLTYGNRIGDFDELIAAICISNNQSIVTRDSHFTRLPGLDVQSY
ncbi:MAG: type II toxin-antitoxin system VapC family toxin [Methanomicrobiales archaeon]|nr:type II toxin-antitoxin system VapC family toxin [Methanomicrobiales archaeon]